ncbi:MAG: hypothetical protein P5702_12725 [Limnospira sp. PMC 1291.21]|nr:MULTISPECIES: hypothetical protein [Limnospira]MDT9178310.1 hypothetical protein [Limnospira sp. PMC 1238.20]MDT9195215.1 hypothetical protein [Limnospira sp. PMC 1245.20]MDT9198650.1 hypothetical protein [Limnospira sp. PMC 1042.18]MDT9203749.1 hypothetical protein [Limnospira sp. PMC 1243.20]MDT9208918.1 hypothetical protein [Limnospira sp. PMC 1252.20]
MASFPAFDSEDSSLSADGYSDRHCTGLLIIPQHNRHPDFVLGCLNHG